METLEGYTYIGTCRCGFGPDAYYQDKRTGRIVNARDLFPRVSYRILEDEEVRTEIAKLKKEKEKLERRILELEKILKEGSKQ